MLSFFPGIFQGSSGRPFTVPHAMHVSIPVRATSHQPAEPAGDPCDGLSPSSWVSPPAPMAPVAPVAGEARELTKRKDREDREELKGEVTKDESLKSKSDTSSKNRVLVSLEISDDELDGDETFCLLLRKLSSYKLTWVLVTALTVLVCSWVVGKKDTLIYMNTKCSFNWE